MNRIHGADFSYSNGYPDWSKLAASGIKFAYSRACYGDIAADDDGDVFTRNHDGAKDHGIAFAAYIFALRWRDPVAQADHFLQVIDGYEGQNRPWIDVEEGSFASGPSTSVESNIEWLAAFSDRIKSKLCVPDIYTNADTWTRYLGGTDGFAGHYFAIANYTGVPGKFDLPAGIPRTQVLVHQYTSDGNLPGVAGRVDLDCLLGGLETISR